MALTLMVSFSIYAAGLLCAAYTTTELLRLGTRRPLPKAKAHVRGTGRPLNFRVDRRNGGRRKTDRA